MRPPAAARGNSTNSSSSAASLDPSRLLRLQQRGENAFEGGGLLRPRQLVLAVDDEVRHAADAARQAQLTLHVGQAVGRIGQKLGSAGQARLVGSLDKDGAVVDELALNEGIMCGRGASIPGQPQRLGLDGCIATGEGWQQFAGLMADAEAARPQGREGRTRRRI